MPPSMRIRLRGRGEREESGVQTREEVEYLLSFASFMLLAIIQILLYESLCNQTFIFGIT